VREDLPYRREQPVPTVVDEVAGQRDGRGIPVGGGGPLRSSGKFSSLLSLARVVVGIVPRAAGFGGGMCAICTTVLRPRGQVRRVLSNGGLGGSPAWQSVVLKRAAPETTRFVEGWT
jgi:hypothetical protein